MSVSMAKRQGGPPACISPCGNSFAHACPQTRQRYTATQAPSALRSSVGRRSPKADEAIRVMADEGVTVAQGVPTQWALMLAHPDFEAADVSHLRIAGTGASRVPPELVREMRARLGCPVVVRYTSTESSLGAPNRRKRCP